MYILVSSVTALAPSLIGINSVWLSAPLFSLTYLSLTFWKIPLHQEDEAIIRNMIKGKNE